MRVLPVVILAGVASLALPMHALARPKPQIAVAPIQGDGDRSVAEAIVDALAGRDFAVVGPADVHREARKLGMSDTLATAEARRLTRELEVAALIDGNVSGAGRARTLRLALHRRGKPDVRLSVDARSPASPGFRRRIHDWVRMQLGGGASDDDDGESARKPADDESTSKRTPDDDAGPRRKLSDDDASRRQADDESAARRSSDNAGTSRRKAGDARRKRVAADDDDVAIRKRKNRGDRDEPTGAARAWVAAGASVAQRRLTYDTRSGFTQPPPRVGTLAAAGRVAGEIYPFALTGSGGTLAAVGLAASYDKTVGLNIKIPNQSVSAPINQAHYAIGARYRIDVGESSTLTAGLDYARRHYIAERGSLQGFVLDAPDVNYTAITPGVAMQVPITPTITMLGGIDAMLLLDAGAIQSNASYGPAGAYGLEAFAGANLAIAKQIGVRVALEYSQIHLSFRGGGTMSNNRDNDPSTQDVNAATDRALGVVATVALAY